MEESNIQFYDSLKEDFWYIHTRQDLLRKVLERLDLPKDSTILDLGCGTGFNHNSLKRFGRVYSIDIMKSALRSCKLRGMQGLIRADAQSLPIRDGVINLVSAIELFEHLDDDASCLDEVSSVLSHDGYLVFTVPAYRFLWSSDDEISFHKRRYSKRTLLKKIPSCFKQLSFSHRYMLLFLPAVLIFMLQRTILKRKKTNSLMFTPTFMNNILKRLLELENSIIARGIYLPLGVGFLCVLKKISK